MTTPDAIARLMNAVRETGPLVQCITNTVIQEISANVLLAIGASPAMCDTASEAGPFADFAHGVLINLGTPHEEQVTGMRRAIDGAGMAGTPWVMDPVAVGALKFRTHLAAEFLKLGPAAIRGNASEVVALAGLGAGGKGVDATDSVDDALEAARLLAKNHNTVVAVSGERDVVIGHDAPAVQITGGDPMMQLVVGTGCSLGAMTAAYLGVSAGLEGVTRQDAVVAAHAHAKAAGSVAATTAKGPGTFHGLFIDALYHATPDTVAQHTTITTLD